MPDGQDLVEDFARRHCLPGQLGVAAERVGQLATGQRGAGGDGVLGLGDGGQDLIGGGLQLLDVNIPAGGSHHHAQPGGLLQQESVHENGVGRSGHFAPFPY